jgi:dihydrofolate reductase
MKIIIIAALDKNGLIGNKNSLPWNFSEDLQHFKKTTSGNFVIMGKKTFQSIGKPLSEREIIVLSRSPEFNPQGVKVARSIEEALSIAKEKVFIAGGASIYKQFLSRADKMILTVINKKFEGDKYFPNFKKSNWELIEEKRGKNKLLTFKTYQKV